MQDPFGRSLNPQLSPASFPGPAQLSVTCSTESNGKLGGAWEQGLALSTKTRNEANLAVVWQIMMFVAMAMGYLKNIKYQPYHIAYLPK